MQINLISGENELLNSNMKTNLNVIDLKNVYSKCFYRAFEVLCHIKPNDFWVILNRRVFYLSNLMKTMDEMPNSGKDLTALHQLNMFGGTDISKLFEERPRNKLEMFDLKSNSEFGKSKDLFWWQDPAYIIGGITTQERHICVRNKARGTQCHVTVCEEDSIYEIRAKFFSVYPDMNSDNIVWRKTESTCCPHGHLFLDKTLTENGLIWKPKDEIVFLWMFHKDEFNTCKDFM